MEKIFVLAGIGVFVLALALDTALARRGRPWLGWLLGLLPMLVFGAAFIIPPLTCESDNPVGCEWAGIGAFFIGGLVLLMLAVYSLMAAGIARVQRPLSRGEPAGVSYRRAAARSLGAAVLLAAAAVLGGWLGWGGFKLVQTGIFVPWQNQGSPPDMDRLPGERAVGFRAVNTGTVQVTTSAGRIFETHVNYCSSPQRRSQNCWYYGSDDLAAGPAPQADPACRIAFRVPNPPGEVVERVSTSNCMYAYTVQAEYVLLADGSVWAWHHEARRGDFSALLWVAGGGLIGMLLGIFGYDRFARNKSAARNDAARSEAARNEAARNEGGG